jgi:hypothetical protein
MTALHTMDAVELRADLDEATALSLDLAAKLSDAVLARDDAWAAGLAVALVPALDHVRRLRQALKLAAVL